MIGWSMVDPTTLAPSSVILMYWAGGAFLMAAKRFSEFREIVASHGRELLERYRASFGGYSEKSLAVSCLVYALCSVLFLAIFLIKYRIEYLLTVPIVIALFAKYFALSMDAGSSAQKPEKLFNEKGLMRQRHASINDVPIREEERKFFWDRPAPRPADHPGLSDLGL